MMDCPNCSTPQPEAARFCGRCGTPLQPGIDRAEHYAAQPEEPVRALALMSTLMPHLTAKRVHVYRDAVTLALLASVIAAAFGVLSISLVLAAVALPAVLLTYIHDHSAWRGEPLTVVGVAFVLALVFGIAVGLLEYHFAQGMLLIAPSNRLPSAARIVELGVLVPIVAFVAVLIAPLLVTVRPPFRHAIDAVIASALSGSALSLGLSIVVQRGAFTRLEAVGGDAAHIAFIALTLGFLQPIILATAAALTVVALQRSGANPVLGAIEGLVLVVIYEMASTLLTPYGVRGIVLTAVVAFVVAAMGLVLVRDELHNALLAEAQSALDGGNPLRHAPTTEQVCAQCGAGIAAGSAFCQVCGTATAALVPHPTPSPAATTQPTA